MKKRSKKDESSGPGDALGRALAEGGPQFESRNKAIWRENGSPPHFYSNVAVLTEKNLDLIVRELRLQIVLCKKEGLKPLISLSSWGVRGKL